MLSFLKRERSRLLEDKLNAAQAQHTAGWEALPEDELFTPAGFSEAQAEATASSNYSYWGSTFRAFFKNRFAVVLLVALAAVVAFAFIQPHLPGQADPNLCAVDPATGIQYRNIAPGQDGFIWGSNSIGQDLWARIWAGARTSLTIAFFVALIEAVADARTCCLNPASSTHRQMNDEQLKAAGVPADFCAAMNSAASSGISSRSSSLPTSTLSGGFLNITSYSTGTIYRVIRVA